MGTPMTVRLVVIRGAMVMVLLVEQKPGAPADFHRDRVRLPYLIVVVV